MIVVSDALILSTLDANVPVIGWDNVVTIGNVAADTEEDSNPATNLANPATHLIWRGEDDTTQNVTVTLNGIDAVDYLAVAKHNFGTEGIVVSVEGATAVDSFQKVLLHFNLDGNSPPGIVDSNAGGSAHTWTRSGNAQIDTTESKFGGGALLCDGTGDYVSTPDHADFALGSSAFTIEMWFKFTGVGSGQFLLAGQMDSAATTASTSFYIERVSGGTNVLRALFGIGAGAVTVSSTTQFTNAVNTGWHHLALTRSGTTLRMFIDGVQEGGNVSMVGSVNNSSNALTIGRGGELAASEYKGWIDEFQLRVGAATWTAGFDTPHAYDQWLWSTLVQATTPDDDGPYVGRFVSTVLSAVRLHMVGGDDAPEAAVLYVGQILQLERSIKVDVDHTPITMGAKVRQVNGRSESGNYLDRIEINRFYESGADFDHFTPSWYRSNFQPFLDARVPFFFNWNPVEYPDEVGFVWLMGDDPTPGVHPDTRRVGISLKYQGIV